MTDLAAHIDQTVEKITDEAIEWYMSSQGWERPNRDPGSNYHHFSDPGLEITPPGKPRAAGGQVTKNGVPRPWGFPELGTGENAGSLVYAHFEKVVRDAFYWWKLLPDPADFDKYIEALDNAAWEIALTSGGNGDGVTKVGNPLMRQVDVLFEKFLGDEMKGQTILAFTGHVAAPLPDVIHGQYALALLAWAVLRGERQIWVNARQDATKIVDGMLMAMQHRGGGTKVNLDTVAALLNAAAVLPGPQKPVIAGAGTALSSLNGILNAKGKAKAEPPLSADSPDEVVRKVNEAFRTLAGTIRGQEGDLTWWMRDALKFVTEPGKGVAFRLPRPELLDETEVDEIDVDFGTLRDLATVTIPDIERQLVRSSAHLAWAVGCVSAWVRPYQIETSDSSAGPYDTWEALVTMTIGLLDDTAWDLKQSGVHLDLASDMLERSESQVEEAMRRHAQKVRGGSGLDPIGDAARSRALWW